MPRRIVLHAGFHKTGTSTVQQILRLNRVALKPHMKSVLKGQMGAVLSAARGYSTWRDPMTLEKFARRFHALLADQPALRSRVLCLSAEELSGHMPGRGALADYGAAVVLADEMARVAQAHWPGVEIGFVYSLRAPREWLVSAYWEHVKSSSMTMDLDTFCDSYASAADLHGIVAKIAQNQPHVTRFDLAACADLPAGPATPVLDLCDVPRDLQHTLQQPPPVNARPDPDVLLALLQANRAYPGRDQRKVAKAAILTAAKDRPA